MSFHNFHFLFKTESEDVTMNSDLTKMLKRLGDNCRTQIIYAIVRSGETRLKALGNVPNGTSGANIINKCHLFLLRFMQPHFASPMR